MCKSRIDTTTLRNFFYETMAIINSRPLTTPGDNDSANPLTPNQMLTMKSKMVALPPGQFDLYSRKRWRQVQSLAQMFWSRWSKEYLQTLQPRTKWQSTQRNIDVGDIVLVQEEATPRNSWPITVVTDVMPKILCLPIEGYINHSSFLSIFRI